MCGATFESLDLTSSQQIAFYDDGVGTSSFKPFAILGGAFGFGLKRNVLEWRLPERAFERPLDGSLLATERPAIRKTSSTRATILERSSI